MKALSKKIDVLPILVLFFLSPIFSFSQDLIIKKDGSKIYCRIIQEDSILLSYQTVKDKPPMNGVIAKVDVEKYYYSKNSSQAQTPESIKIDSASSERNKLLHLSLFGGLAMPRGAYGDKDPKKEEAGLAHRGSVMGISVTLKLSRFIGLSAVYFYQQNHFDQDLILSLLRFKYPNNEFISSRTPWKINGLMGGVYLTFPIKAFRNLYLEFNMLIGKPQYTSPKLIMNIKYEDGDTEERIQNKSTISAWTYFFNAGFRYKMTKNIFFVVGMDYLKSRANFFNILVEDTYTHVAYDPYKWLSVIDLTQEIRSFNLKMGMVFTINRKNKNYKI